MNNGYYYGSVYPGVMLLTVGIIFLLNAVGPLKGHAWGVLWPFFVIVPGIMMLCRPRGK